MGASRAATSVVAGVAAAAVPALLVAVTTASRVKPMSALVML